MISHWSRPMRAMPRMSAPMRQPALTIHPSHQKTNQYSSCSTTPSQARRTSLKLETWRAMTKTTQTVATAPRLPPKSQPLPNRTTRAVEATHMSRFARTTLQLRASSSGGNAPSWPPNKSPRGASVKMTRWTPTRDLVFRSIFTYCQRKRK